MLTDWRPEVGTVLDNAYRLDEEIGVGPVSVNYLATDVRDEGRVWVKVFPPALFDGQLRGPNILRLQRSRAYVHQGLARLSDIVLTGDALYAVRDVVDALPYDRWLDENAPVSRERIAAHMNQLVDVIAHIHQIGVHGNIKPSNVFVGADERLVVTDPWFLGGAETIQGSPLRSRSNRWLAPEQKDADDSWQERPETDVFLLGLMLGWLLAGRVTAAGRPLNGQRVMVREAVDEVYVRATQRLPSERFGDVEAFRQALMAAWADIELLAANPEQTSPSTPLHFAPSVDSEEVEAQLPEVLEPSVEELEAAKAEAVEVAALMLESTDGGDIFEVSQADIIEEVSALEGGDSSPPELDRGEPITRQEAALEEAETAEPDIDWISQLEASEEAEITPTRPSSNSTEAVTRPTSSLNHRSRSIYFAPFLVVLAAVSVFFLLRTMNQPSPSAPEPAASQRVVEAAVTSTTTPSEPTLPQESQLIDASESGQGAAMRDEADTLSGALADAQGAHTGAADVTSPPADAATPPQGTNDIEANKGPIAAVSAKPDVKETPQPTKPPKKRGEDPKKTSTKKAFNLKDYRCPKGMARVRGRKTIEGDDGAKRKVNEVWCTDKFEYPGAGAMPTTGVTLAAARSACSSQGKRLCTTREWRIACGGGRYPYRGEYDPDRCNTVGADGMPSAVIASGSKKRCKSAFGTYDMVGNVAEWTADGRVNGGSSKRGESASCYKSGRRMGGSSYVGFRCCADARRAAD